ncbi:MAG TPA: AraC family transcriptional regulator [Longimicrobium sp.]|nr:AraC family transcriptional regulator [Longimicrobium sp.]
MRDNLRRARGGFNTVGGMMRIRADGLVFRVTEYAAGERMPGHWHPVTSVSLVMRGCVQEAARGTELQSTCCAVVVKPAGTVHANRFGPAGARLASIDLPEGWEARTGRGAAELARWRWVQGGPPARTLWRLLAAAHAEPEHGPALLASGFWEMVDALGEEGAAAPGPSAPGWLARVRDRLHDEAAAPPRVRELADAAGVHPVYLARAFRRAYGVPVTEYQRRLRVMAAAHRIASTDEPLARVAYAAGFADQAHLTRGLRADTGLTPGALRRLARA